MQKNNQKPHAFFRSTPLVWGALMALCMAGCAGGRYSPESHKKIMALKETHLQFIDEFTEDDEGKDWELLRFDREALQVGLEFNKALEFAETLADKQRILNFQLLKNTFQDDRALIGKKSRLLTPIESETLLKPTLKIYEKALEAECVRTDGPGVGELCIPSDRWRRKQ